ncbi:hypothetical protein [Actinoplanes utahensis]|uniref:hypothetical protein n=1 Tax=Actinoplanes utahensis TaxID=1869 RepID=UPI00068E7185|nr:hypothetical protein [Actinoplanes utahensis]GIF27836.1 hypothetical protein Aut01nite_08220 [Actinoplanes utahensis]
MSKAAALVGLVLVVLGARMALTGRAPAVIARSFRTPREAGVYHLLFGLALLVFSFGMALLADLAATIATVLAIGLCAVAVVCFRPGARGRGGQRPPARTPSGM